MISIKREHPYPSAKQVHRLVVTEEQHTPSNKRPFEVESVAYFNVTRNAVSDWTELEMREVTQTKAGPQTRTISITIDAAQRRELLAYLLEELTC